MSDDYPDSVMLYSTEALRYVEAWSRGLRLQVTKLALDLAWDERRRLVIMDDMERAIDLVLKEANDDRSTR